MRRGERVGNPAFAQPVNCGDGWSLASTGMETYVVRVWVPDRPGALGQVASRIGSVGGDVVGIDILERGAGRAIDELVVTLPSAELVPLLVAEISQVDEAAVEEIHHLDGTLPEPGTAALDLAARLVEAVAGERLDVLCDGLRNLFAAEWVSIVDAPGAAALRSIGEDAPEPGWLLAYVAGSRHLPPDTSPAARTDLAWAEMTAHGCVLAIGRSRPALRSRERRQVVLLGRVLDGLAL